MLICFFGGSIPTIVSNPYKERRSSKAPLFKNSKEQFREYLSSA
jgi:hypothetical protein